MIGVKGAPLVISLESVSGSFHFGPKQGKRKRAGKGKEWKV